VNDRNCSNAFRDALTRGRFVYGTELVTTRGLPPTGSPDKLAELGAAFGANPRIAWISVTDSPSGIPMLPPDWLGRTLGGGKEILLHLSCKDRNRAGLESTAWSYAAEGFRNVLALSGDCSKTGYRGAAKPAFDLDSVSLVGMLNDMNGGMKVPGRKGETVVLPPTDFFIGCAVSPFKLLESELITQYLKLLRKIAAGAGFVVPQLGYDMRKFHEIKLFLESRGVKVPVIGNVYLLNRTVAGVFHRGLFPGCVVSKELFDLVEKYAAGPDKGKGFFLELAAKQMAVFRGLGFAGGYLAGLSKGETFDEIVNLAEGYAPDDWKAFAREIQYAREGEFYLFDRDPGTGLGALGRLNPEYLKSLERPPRTRHVTVGYRASRIVHSAVFTRDRGLFGTMKAVFSRLDPKGVPARLFYSVERLGKAVLYGCRDCGDCSLPDCAYLCPVTSCAKNQRNGPCGGSNEGICETGEMDCIWVGAYERLKYYHEAEKNFSGPIVYTDAGLEGTSSWANAFLGRDHSATVGVAGTGAAGPRTAESGRGGEGHGN
jgi:methylenetetrahydrofolate reductase (NADPH)